MLDYHVVLDTLPTIASLYFEKRLGPEVKLSAVQSSILLAIGLQRKTVEEVEVCDPYILVKHDPHGYPFHTRRSCSYRFLKL